jgi:transposase
MRFVELKSQEQLDLQALHRVALARWRTLLNHLCAILLERDHIFRKGDVLEAAVDALVIDPASEISGRGRQLVTDIRREWQVLHSHTEALNAEFVAIARHDDAARGLVTIPGVGVLNATALVVAVGDASAFRRGRDLGAWLGLVPKQHTTGGKPKLLGISKRGNKYLRMLFIHGARAAMPSLAESKSPLGSWLRGLLARTHRNIAIVASALRRSDRAAMKNRVLG